jgi:hypothetical protein
MNKIIIISLLLCCAVNVCAQKYIFNSALKKTKYGNLPATEHIKNDQFFSYNSRIILDINRNILNVDNSLYKIVKVEKSFFKNGDTEIKLSLLSNNNTTYSGYFLIKNDAYISNFILSAKKMRVEYNIELDSFKK